MKGITRVKDVIVMAVAVVSSAVAIGCFGWSVLVTWWREDWE